MASIGAVTILTGKKVQEVCDVVPNFAGVAGRMEVVSSNPLVIVDFAHTDDGMISRSLWIGYGQDKRIIRFVGFWEAREGGLGGLGKPKKEPLRNWGLARVRLFKGFGQKRGLFVVNQRAELISQGRLGREPQGNQDFSRGILLPRGVI